MNSVAYKIMESRYQRNGTLSNGILKEIAMSPQKRSGPIYTMSGHGGHVLMNSQSILTATSVQFVPPVRPNCTMIAKKVSLKPSFVEPIIINPILNKLRGLFSLFFWPMIRPQSKDMAIEIKVEPKTEQHLANSETQLHPNIYMNLVPDLSALSFLDYDEFADDRLDSPIDLKQFDFMPKAESYGNEMGKVMVDASDVHTEKKSKCELNTAHSIDTTDFICAFAMAPQEPAPFSELKLLVVDAVKELKESRPQDVQLEQLPPAVGQRNGITVEDAIEVNSYMQKTGDSNYGNVLKCHRRAANKINGYRKGSNINNYNSKRTSKKATHSAKNRCSKSRHQLALNIQDDLDDMYWMVDDNDDDDHPANDERPIIAISRSVTETIVVRSESTVSTSTELNVIETVRPACMFPHFFRIGERPTKQQQRQFQKPWPMMAPTHRRPLTKIYFDSPQPIRRRKRMSESESDDSFIMFAEDSPRSIPSMDALLLDRAPSNATMGIILPNCIGHLAVNNLNINNNAMRQRKWSESSDDFICFESDDGDVDVFEDDSESDDETADETDSDDESDIDDEHLSNNLPDSGVEEKRVNICKFYIEIERNISILLAYGVVEMWPIHNGNRTPTIVA